MIFPGDGRNVMQPEGAPFGTRPVPLTRARARRIVQAFLESGRSHHGPGGSTVWVITLYCRREGIPHAFVTHPDDAGNIIGYSITRGIHHEFIAAQPDAL